MARETTVLCSIINGGKSVENVTVDSVSWSTDNGTIMLSATVPSTVNIGDTLTDSSANSYLITGISGSDLTAQDFDSATDPATGSATIQEAYQSPQLWEADHDDTIIYRSGDTARGEMYSSGGKFTTAGSITVNAGDTVGLNQRILTAANNEKHDGTAGSGVEIEPSSGFNENILYVTTSDNFEVSWIELDGTNMAGGASSGIRTSSGAEFVNVKNLLIHDTNGMGVRPNASDLTCMNTIIYDTIAEGVRIGDGARAYFYNLTVYNSTTYGIRNYYSSNGLCENCISVSSVIADFQNANGSFGTINNCMSEDDTADDFGGSGHLINKSATNLFVSIVGGSVNLHLKENTAAIGKGLGLHQTPDGVQYDIDNFDRSQFNGALPWDIGAHQYQTTQTNYSKDGSPGNVKRIKRKIRLVHRLPENIKPPRGTLLNKEHPLVRNLVGCYLFNEGTGLKVFDLSGNGYKGTLDGASWGRGGIEIWQSEDRITGDWTGTDAQVGTIEMLVKLNWSHPTSDQPFFWDTYGGINQRYVLYYEGSDYKTYLYTQTTERGSFTYAWEADKLYHIVAVWPENKLYINGLFVNDFDDGYLGSNATTLYIGDRFEGTDFSLNGVVHLTRWYNKALTISEVKSLYVQPYEMFNRPVVTNILNTTSKGLVLARR